MTTKFLSPSTLLPRVRNANMPFYGKDACVHDEKDACGVAFIANLKGIAHHETLGRLLKAVRCMKHRTGCGPDGSGDGIGVLVTLPTKLFQDWLQSSAQIEVVDQSRIAVAMCYMSQDHQQETEGVELIRAKTLALLGNETIVRVRDVPIDESVPSPKARETMPRIRQIVIVRPASFRGDYDKALYLIRKQVEREIKEKKLDLYICSMSSTQVDYEGMLYGGQLQQFFAADFENPLFEIVAGIGHGRFGTNTRPSWARAQPYRMLCHNGEVVTLPGNRAHVRAWRLRSGELSERSGGFILDDDTTDSGQLDNTVEALYFETGLPIEYLLSMVVPQSYKDKRLSPAAQEMFFNHFVRMKGWLGPTAIYALERGRRVVACLGRSNLRPSRFQKIRSSNPELDLILCASDLDAFDVAPEELEDQQPLGITGGIVVADTESGQWSYGREIYDRLATAYPFERLNSAAIELPKLASEPQSYSNNSLLYAALHCWQHHDLWTVLAGMLDTGKPKNRAMGYNVPPFFLSERGQDVSLAFKQRFNQITAPPFDSVREERDMNLEVLLGPLDSPFESPVRALRKKFRLSSPILLPEQFRWIRDQKERKVAVLDATFPLVAESGELERNITRLCTEAAAAVRGGARVLIVSDKKASHERVVIPMVIAVGAINRHLINVGLRFDTGILANTGFVRGEEHVAMLLSFGANAVHPYLLYEMGEWFVGNTQNQDYKSITPAAIAQRIQGALEKGVRSIIGKVGTSAIWEYQGAGQFEAYGMTRELVDRVCGPDVPSFFHANGVEEMQELCLKLHRRALLVSRTGVLADDGVFSGNPAGGEPTSYGSGVLALAHKAAGADNLSGSQELNWQAFDAYQKATADCGLVVPRRAFRVKALGTPIALDRVEPAEQILRRFFSGDMSLGALIPPVKRDISIALNRLGMLSNSGEGGVDPRTETIWSDGSDLCDGGRQIASGRFGVTARYLRKARSLTFKAAQGAKPGLGGMLPPHKVIPLFARLRGCNPFTELYSPFEHKDTFSIEDYAGVLEEMARVNRKATRVTKCVAHLGVEVIATGCAKAGTTAFLVSAGDGGTGASTWEAIKSSGGFSEVGVRAVHQMLASDGLRNSCEVWVDGGIRDTHDILTLACLGADRFGFGTLLLVLLTCVKANTCNINCPADVTTISPDGNLRYTGRPENIVRFFTMFVQRLREAMAERGIRSLDEIIGRSDLLEFRDDTPFLAGLKQKLAGDMEWLFKPSDVAPQQAKFTGAATIIERNFAPDIDLRILSEAATVLSGDAASIAIGPLRITNRDRFIGGYLAGELAEHNPGWQDLAVEDSVVVRFASGGAGNSFGYLLPKGFTFLLEGFANDAVGKSMEGGKIVVTPPRNLGFSSLYTPLCGDIPCFGATGGKLYVAGGLGNRAGVRNSGATIVCHQLGDHGFCFNTLGTVVVLGPIGSNFGAGSSGGVAYVLQSLEEINRLELVNKATVELGRIDSEEELAAVLAILTDFHAATGSTIAEQLLAAPEKIAEQLVRVSPIRKVVTHPITGKVLYSPEEGVLYQEPQWLKTYCDEPVRPLLKVI